MLQQDDHGAKPDRAAGYRAQAEQCRQAATTAHLPEVRQAYLELADDWEEMAQQADAA